MWFFIQTLLVLSLAILMVVEVVLPTFIQELEFFWYTKSMLASWRRRKGTPIDQAIENIERLQETVRKAGED